MFLNNANPNIVVICSGSYLTINVYFVIFGFQAFRFMQFAGKTPPPSIIILFVTFFPLQGFFNLVVYMFPRILRYFEEGVPLTQSFRRSSFLSSLRRSSSSGVRSSKLFSKKSSSQKPTELGSGFSQEESGVGKTSSAFVSEEGGADEKRNSQVSFAEGIVQDGDAQALELDDDGGDKEKDMDEGEIEDGGTGEREEGEKDNLDELERIVEA